MQILALPVNVFHTSQQRPCIIFSGCIVFHCESLLNKFPVAEMWLLGFTLIKNVPRTRTEPSPGGSGLILFLLLKVEELGEK